MDLSTTCRGLGFHSKPGHLMVAVALACGELNCRVPWPQQRSGCIYALRLYKTAIGHCSDTGDLDGFWQLDPVPICITVWMGPGCNQTVTSQ